MNAKDITVSLPVLYLYGTPLFSIGLLAIFMVHCFFSIGPLSVSMVHYHLQMAIWLSLWYTAIFFWPTGPPYGKLPSSTPPLAIPMVLPVSSTGTLAISMVQYHLLLAHWLSLWCTTIFYWPTGPLYATLLSSIGQLAISMVHYHLLLAQWPLPM